MTGTNQYGVWYTDSNGNYQSNIGLVSGTSTTFESLETSFQQDLNGDGIIGIPPSATAPATAPTSLWLRDVFAAGNGPALAELVHAAPPPGFQLPPASSILSDAHDDGGYLAHFLLTQANANLFGH